MNGGSNCLTSGKSRPAGPARSTAPAAPLQPGSQCGRFSYFAAASRSLSRQCTGLYSMTTGATPLSLCSAFRPSPRAVERAHRRHPFRLRGSTPPDGAQPGPMDPMMYEDQLVFGPHGHRPSASCKLRPTKPPPCVTGCPCLRPPTGPPPGLMAILGSQSLDGTPPVDPSQATPGSRGHSDSWAATVYDHRLSRRSAITRPSRTVGRRAAAPPRYRRPRRRWFASVPSRRLPLGGPPKRDDPPPPPDGGLLHPGSDIWNVRPYSHAPVRAPCAAAGGAWSPMLT